MANGDSYGLFWDSNEQDRTYNAGSFELWLKKFYYTGVFANELAVTESSGVTVAVGGGYCNIDGKVKSFESTTITLDAPNSTYPRIDTIVIERNDSDRNIIMKAITGAISGSTPVPTAPVRSGGIYQIVLAQIYVKAGATAISQSDITDTRADKTLCGFVTGTVEQIDFEEIMAQYKAQFEVWFDEMKDQLDTDAAGHLQNEIDALPASILNACHPVGSYYYTSDNLFDPNVSFGGTWTLLEEGRFLLSAGENYPIDETGGNVDHTHEYKLRAAVNWGMATNEDAYVNNLYDYTNERWANGTSIGSGGSSINKYATMANRIGGSSSFWESKGDVKRESNMPPYIGAYCWHRTA